MLRLERTVNTKSGEIARVTHVAGRCGEGPANYDFNELAEVLVGQVVATAPGEERRRAVDRPLLAMPGLVLRRLNWGLV